MKVLSVFGTRPEAIKFAPVIQSLRANSFFSTFICTSSQHREMLDQVLDVFKIKADFDLGIMEKDQDLFHTTTQILNRLRDVLKQLQPDLVLVQGDASTAFAAALSAYYARIRVAHIEAGLRTYNNYAPYPEEFNRRAISLLADAHFAPTAWARDNLLKENIPADKIWVTGNTSIDALRTTINRIEKDATLRNTLEAQFSFLNPDRKIILVTAHRRESFGKALEEICLALRDVALSSDDVQLVYPVHLSPNVLTVVERILGHIPKATESLEGLQVGRPLPNLFLIKPLDYTLLVYLLRKTFIVLTDSGGLQEEAPTLGKPVLVMRDVTERPEVIQAGVAKLVGRRRTTIVSNTLGLLNDPAEYDKMAKTTTVYGDGHAAEKIVAALKTMVD